MHLVSEHNISMKSDHYINEDNNKNYYHMIEFI